MNRPVHKLTIVINLQLLLLYLKLVVSIEAELVGHSRIRRSTVVGIAAKRHLLSAHYISIEPNSKYCQDNSKAVANTIDILLSIDEFVERCDTVTSQKTVVAIRSSARLYPSFAYKSCPYAAVFKPGQGPRMSVDFGAWYSCAVSPCDERHRSVVDFTSDVEKCPTFAGTRLLLQV